MVDPVVRVKTSKRNLATNSVLQLMENGQHGPLGLPAVLVKIYQMGEKLNFFVEN